MKLAARLSIVRLMAVTMLVLLTLPAQAAQAAGLGVSGKLIVHTGGFDMISHVLSYDLATGLPLAPSLDFAPQAVQTNGRGVTFDREGNIWTSGLKKDTSESDPFTSPDKRIYKHARLDGTNTSISVPYITGVGALDYDPEENVLWAAEYQPQLGVSWFYKIDPATGAKLASCSYTPFTPGGGAGNDTLAIGRLPGLGKVLLTDVADGNLSATTLIVLVPPAAPNLIGFPCGVSPTTYNLKLNGSGGTPVARVTGIGLDPWTHDLVVASIRSDEGSTDILNLGPPPFQNQVGAAINVGGLVYDVSIDTALDDFNRADGSRYLGNLGPSWTGAVNGGTYRISGGQLKAQNSGYVYWNATSFGTNQYAGVSFSQVSGTASDQDLLLKVNGIAPDGGAGGGDGGNNWSAIEVQYDATAHQLYVNTHVPYTPSRPQWYTHSTLGLTLNAGDQLAARAQGGVVTIYRNGEAIQTTDVTAGPSPFPSALANGGGYVGIWIIGAGLSSPSMMDDFRGGNIGP